MRTIALIPLLLLFLACTCRRESKKDYMDSVVVQTEEVRPDPAAAVMTEEPADTVPAWMAAFPATAQDDSIRPVMRWRFNLADGTFPHIRYGRRIIIKGLETDGRGTFYVMGGSPSRLVCYRDTLLLYSRRLEDFHSNLSLIRLVGDSLWIVEENLHRIVRVSCHGTGDIERYDIPLDSSSCIVYGKMTQTGYTLLTQRYYHKGQIISLDSLDGFVDFDAREYGEPGEWYEDGDIEKMNASRRYYRLDYPARMMEERDFPESDYPLYPHIDDSLRRGSYIVYYHYIDRYRSWRVYAGYWPDGYSYVALTDDDGRLLCKREMADVPYCQTDDNENAYGGYAGNRFLVRGNYLFTIGNTPGVEKVEILAFDLRELLPEGSLDRTE